MNIDTFFETLDSYFERNEIDRIDSFLVSSLEQAKEEEDYAAYISICNEMIGFYRSTSAFEKAYVAAEDVLLLMEELKLDHTEHFATTLLNAATAYRAAGDYAHALRFYRQALQIYEGIIPPEDYRYAGLYNNMSILLEKMDENEEAVACAKKALAIMEKTEGGEIQTAVTLTNMALVYLSFHSRRRQRRCWNGHLLFREDGEGTDEHYSGALAGMGEACYRMEEYEKALEYYERALEKVKFHYGENVSYGVLCENCAAVCEKMGDTQGQNRYVAKAREVMEKFGR